MNRTILHALVLACTLLLMSSAAMAAECSGSWNVLPYYRPGSGGVCAALGLDTHRAVCQPGQRYATYCDDASGGRYRICQSNIPCFRDRHRDYRHDGWNDSWDYRRDRRDDRRYWRDDRRDWRDYRNDDYRQRSWDCTQWDYTRNRPCSPGTVNRDCQKGCDGSAY